MRIFSIIFKYNQYLQKNAMLRIAFFCLYKMLKKPNSMEDCHYFTNRTLEDGKGRIMAWVFRKECPKCRQGIMGKPLKKNGRIDKKAEHFVCYKCNYQESEEQVDEGLIVNVEYKCPHCGNEGETTAEYKRKMYQGVLSYVFQCQKCNAQIPITKKLKEIKKKRKEDNIV